MADPTLVNGQVSDAITQTSLSTLGLASTQGLATNYQMGAHADGLAVQNATANQHKSTTLSASTTTQAVAQILSLAPSQSARATVETHRGPRLVGELIALSEAVKTLRRRNNSQRKSMLQPGSNAQSDDTSPNSPSPDPAIDAITGALADNLSRLAGTIRSLAATRKGDPYMYDQQALEAIRAAADRLNTLLEELAKHMTALPSPDIWRRLCGALDELRSATHKLEGTGRPAWCPPIQPPPPVPVGATPNPNVTIMGSWNTTTTTPRVVGASW